MTSGFTLMPAFCTSAAASKMARDLHLGDFRINDAQPAAAESEHRVELVQFLDALLDLLDRHAHFFGQILLRRVVVRQEFVQRRIEEADRRRQALQFPEDADEIVASGTAAFWPAPFSGLPGCRPESFRAWRQCGCPRRTCARCGTGRCPWRRTRSALAACSGVSALVRTCSLVTLRHQSISLLEHLVGRAFLGHRAISRPAPGRFPTRRSCISPG